MESDRRDATARAINCFWCGHLLASSRDDANVRRFTRDHFPARVNRRDFPHLPYGVVYACFDCNNARGTDDRWIPFSWRTEEDKAYIREAGTKAILDIQSRLPDDGERQILRPELYEFILTAERFGGKFSNEESEEDSALGV